MKFLFLFLLLFIHSDRFFAQSPAHLLQKGDSFVVETIANTNSLYQRGDQNLEVDTRIRTTKQYTVENASGTEYIFVIKTEKLFDTVSAIGREAYYNSEALKDSSSLAEKAIKNIIADSDTVRTDNKGVIISSGKDTLSYFSDTLVAFVGLTPSYYPKGRMLDFFTTYSLPPSFEKGYTWTDSVTLNGRRTISNYTIDSVTENTIIIEYSRKITDAYANTNTNGVEVIDKHSGIVLQRVTQNSILEFEVLDHTFFSIGRRSAVAETCTYIPVKE